MKIEMFSQCVDYFCLINISDEDFIACDFKKLLYGKYKLSVDEIKIWEIVGDGTVILFANRVVVKYHEFIKCNKDQEKKENFLISSFSNFKLWIYNRYFYPIKNNYSTVI